MIKKYFSNKYSKIFTLNALLKTLNEAPNSNSKLMIHTSNGIYIGKLKEQVDYDNLDIQEHDDILTIYRKMYLNALNNYENNDMSDEIERISENSISITLEDVEVMTSFKLINLPFVEIFVDQIIGFSLGSISQ